MTIELIKRMMDTCYLAKRARDMLPPLPDGVMPSYIQYLDAIQKLEAKGLRVKVSDLSDAQGGMDSPAYKSRSVSQKLFMECNRDIQDWFNVNSRNNVPKKRFDEAVEYIKKWRPCANSIMLIQVTNNQTQMPM